MKNNACSECRLRGGDEMHSRGWKRWIIPRGEELTPNMSVKLIKNILVKNKEENQ